jgi:hypothetical protein
MLELSISSIVFVSIVSIFMFVSDEEEKLSLVQLLSGYLSLLGKFILLHLFYVKAALSSFKMCFGDGGKSL